MDDIKRTYDERGRLTEIRIPVERYPDLAADFQRLFAIRQRLQRMNTAERERATHPAGRLVASLERKKREDFLEQLRTAEAGPFLTETEFFDHYPQWRRTAAPSK